MSGKLDHLGANEIFLDMIISVGESMLCTEVNNVPFDGAYVLSWPEESANAILMEDYTELNDNNHDAGCEFTSIMLGNCKPKFNNLCFKFQHTIPVYA